MLQAFRVVGIQSYLIGQVSKVTLHLLNVQSHRHSKSQAFKVLGVQSHPFRLGVQSHPSHHRRSKSSHQLCAESPGPPQAFKSIGVQSHYLLTQAFKAISSHKRSKLYAFRATPFEQACRVTLFLIGIQSYRRSKPSHQLGLQSHHSPHKHSES